ncbi:MAG: MiaB/RimO family radical SAM methylthiotransferase, partial [Bacteroidales bacterium]
KLGGRSFSCAISEVETIFPAYSSDDRTRSFLKVQDGCDYHCSYCTIPLARGKSRNHSIKFLVQEAQEIASKGIKEIVLTGVNTGDFGRSTKESFSDLLKALVRTEGIERIRVSSIEPNLLTEEVIVLLSKDKKFLPHFHIPLQSGSNKILASMKRRYNRELFAQRLELIRRYIPNAFIGVDVIVGFPGETESDFSDTYNFLESLAPSFLHLFPYSKRSNTPAAKYVNQVNSKIKNERVRMLSKLSSKLYSNFELQNRGREEEVLFENTVKGGKMHGYTRNYIRVERPYNKEHIGEIVKVIL